MRNNKDMNIKWYLRDQNKYPTMIPKIFLLFKQKMYEDINVMLKLLWFDINKTMKKVRINKR